MPPRLKKPASTPAPPERARAFTLGAQLDPEGQVAAVVPVTWCLDIPVLEAEFSARPATSVSPHIILVVRRLVTNSIGAHASTEWLEVAHYIAPLDRGVQYITLTSPGRHEVRAAVVSLPNAKSARDLRDGLAADFIYDGMGVFNEDGTLNAPNKWTRLRADEANVIYSPDVVLDLGDVPREMFAREPRAVTKRFTTFWLGRDRSDDQCDYRGRVVVATLMALVFAVPLAAFRLVLLLGSWLMLIADLNYRALLAPLSDTFTMFYDARPRWLTRKDGTEQRTFMFLYGFLNPITLGVLPLLGAWLAGFHGHPWSFGHRVQYAYTDVLPLICALMVAIALMIGLCVGASFAVERLRNGSRHLTVDPTGLQRLDCSPGHTPNPRVTVRLRYQGLKRTFCKPFAR